MIRTKKINKIYCISIRRNDSQPTCSTVQKLNYYMEHIWQDLRTSSIQVFRDTFPFRRIYHYRGPTVEILHLISIIMDYKMDHNSSIIKTTMGFYEKPYNPSFY